MYLCYAILAKGMRTNEEGFVTQPGAWHRSILQAEDSGIFSLRMTLKGSQKSYSGYIMLCKAEFLTGGSFVEVVYKSSIYFTRMNK